MFIGGTLLTAGTALFWASSLMNLPTLRLPGLVLGVVGGLVAGFGALVYSRKQSPILGLYAGAALLAGAAFMILYSTWSGTPRWAGIVLIAALVPALVWASRLK